MSLEGRKACAVLLMLFLAACGGQATVAPPPATLLPSRTPSQAETSTQPATSVLTPTPTLTVTPDSTIPVATMSAMQTLGAASASACESAASAGRTALSPDGEWVAIVCKLNLSNSRTTYTKVFRLDGTASWKVPFYETYGIFQKENSPEGIHDGTMELYHWSKDGQFAYFIPDFCCLDMPQSDFFNYFRTGAALYRLDLGSGKITTTLHPDLGDIFSGYAFSFSPNDKYLVYRSPEKYNDVTIYTLETGSIESVNLTDKYWLYGGFAWSADSKKLAFLAYSNKSLDRSIYSYFAMSVSNLSPNLLVEKEELYQLTWTQENNLVFMSLFGGDDLLFDFSSHFFTVIPTPTP